MREIKVKFSFFPHKITSANKYIPEGFFQDVQETILDHDWSSLIPIFDFFFQLQERRDWNLIKISDYQNHNMKANVQVPIKCYMK